MLLLLGQAVMLGIFNGSVYSLIAIGFTLIFGVARIVNLGHGTFYMLGAYLTYALYTYARLNIFIDLIISVLLVSLIGIAMDYFLIRPMRSMPNYITVITLAFALVIQYLIFLIFGSQPRNVPEFVRGEILLLGVRFSNQRLLVLIISIVVILSVAFFLKKTSFGKAIRAVSQNRDASILVGVEPTKIFIVTMGMAAGMAALAGGAISPILNVEPTIWFFPLIKAFSIVLLGGMGSLSGSIIGAFLLGFAEGATAFFISTYLQNLVSLFIIIIVLVVRPSGLFGKMVK